MSRRAIDRALVLADLFIGMGEAGSNNRGPFVESCFRGVRKRGNWCAAFVALVLEEAGAIPRLRDRDRRGVKRLAKVIAKLGRRVDTPVPGAVIAWHRFGVRDWRGHIELCEEYDQTTDTLTTIAGNVGRFPAQVQRRVYPAGLWRRRLYMMAIPGQDANKATDTEKPAPPPTNPCPFPDGCEPDVITGG